MRLLLDFLCRFGWGLAAGLALTSPAEVTAGFFRVNSLVVMGIATFLIGILPPATTPGFSVLAPAILVLLRFCQGVGLGGEWSGASLLATEYAEKKKRAFAAMWPQLGAPFGFILANGFMLLLTIWFNFNSTVDGTDHSFLVWGWRIPFLASVVMVLLGLWVRVKLEETPVFKHAETRGEKVTAPVLEVFKTSWVQIIQGTFDGLQRCIRRPDSVTLRRVRRAILRGSGDVLLCSRLRTR